MARTAPALDRPTLNRRVWALARELGLSADELRDVALQLTGVRKKATGEGTISGLTDRQLQRVVDHLASKMGGHGGARQSRYSAPRPSAQRATWLASPEQVGLIHHLHRQLADAGIITDPSAFMRSVTGRDRAEHLPKTGSRRVSAQGYIELLKDKARSHGLL